MAVALAVALGWTSTGVTAQRARPTSACQDGQYVLSDVGFATDRVPVLEIAEGVARLVGLCGDAPLRAKRRRGAIVLRTRIKGCGAAGTVAIDATLERRTCRRLSARVRTGEKVARVATTKSVRVLVFTSTKGFRHASIDRLKQVLGSLDPGTGVIPRFTEDAQAFSDEGLADYDVVLFGNTTGDVLDDSQQAAMERFVRSGRGYVGVHSAADTEYGWPWYGRLVGAYFVSHPLLPVEVTVTTEDPDHPSTAHLAPTFTFTDEIYNFDRNPRVSNTILLTVDEDGFIYPNVPSTPSMGADHPVAWYKEFDGGRSFYTNLGHRPETWDDPRFLTHLLAGIRWAAGPIGYSRSTLTGELRNPMAIAVTPESDVYIIERTGEVRLWSSRTGETIDAAVLPVDTTQENGLLGITLDPDFANNRWVYLYYSQPIPDPPPSSGPPGLNVLARFRARRNGELVLGSRVELLRVPSERQCCHEAGSLAFGPDGALFVSTGDNTNPFESDGAAPIDERPGREVFNAQRTAQNPFDLRGKILRINPDGTTPPGNMFPPSGALGRPEIFAMGCRNPFRIAVDQQTGRVFWGEVGPDGVFETRRGPRGYDEINVAGRPGNYGWPRCIAGNLPYDDFDYARGTVGGAFVCDAMTPALLAYDYVTVSQLALGNALTTENAIYTGRTAIAGTFYRRPSPTSRFFLPPPFTDVLLMTDWTRDVIAAVQQAADGSLGRVVRFAPWEQFHRPIDLEPGPDGALYVLEYGTNYYGDNDDAVLTRIEHTTDGQLWPVATIEASTAGGRVPLDVAFSADASRAPGLGDTVVRYLWDFDGNGRIDARGPRVRHTFREEGTAQVRLTVVSRTGKRSLPTVKPIVVGNTPPAVSIMGLPSSTVPDGTEIVLTGAAVDAEDGALPCDRLLWDIRLGHNAHSHPMTTVQGCEARVRVEGVRTHGNESFFMAIELTARDFGTAKGTSELVGRATARIDVD